MNKYSVNNKLNAVLTEIEDDLLELGIDEVKRYMKEFRYATDYNIAQYGNMVIYYDDLRDFYKRHGYKSMDRMSNYKLWETYKRQVGYIARQITR